MLDKETNWVYDWSLTGKHQLLMVGKAQNNLKQRRWIMVRQLAWNYVLRNYPDAARRIQRNAERRLRLAIEKEKEV